MDNQSYSLYVRLDNNYNCSDGKTYPANIYKRNDDGQWWSININVESIKVKKNNITEYQRLFKGYYQEETKYTKSNCVIIEGWLKRGHLFKINKIPGKKKIIG